MQSSRGASQAARVRIGVCVFFFPAYIHTLVRACTLKHTPIRCAALVYFRLGKTTAGLFFFFFLLCKQGGWSVYFML